jgi:hypothetical protein
MLDCKGVVEGITYPARLWQSEMRHGEEVYARLRDGRRM